MWERSTRATVPLITTTKTPETVSGMSGRAVRHSKADTPATHIEQAIAAASRP